MKKITRGFIFAIIAAFLMTTIPAFAEGTGGISISGAFIPWGDAYAGSGFGAPKYDDAFNPGWGVRVEPFYDFNQLIRGVMGFTYQSWSGDTYSGYTFDDLNLWSIYIGVKFRFLPGSPVRPYVLTDFGYAHLDPVNLSAGSLSWRYWDGTDTYLLDFGGGVEFVATPNLSLFFDVRGQVSGVPDSAWPPSSDADNLASLPMSFGINFKW